MLAVAIFGYETSTYTPSSDDESLKSAKWAAGFGALLGFPCTLFLGNLHWGSPAQWPIPRHRRHWDSRSRLCWRVSWLRTSLPFWLPLKPLPFPWLCQRRHVRQVATEWHHQSVYHHHHLGNHPEHPILIRINILRLWNIDIFGRVRDQYFILIFFLVAFWSKSWTIS